MIRLNGLAYTAQVERGEHRARWGRRGLGVGVGGGWEFPGVFADALDCSVLHRYLFSLAIMIVCCLCICTLVSAFGAVRLPASLAGTVEGGCACV